MANFEDLSDFERQEVAELEALGDEGIDLSDAPEVKDWSGAVRGVYFRPIKKPLSVRLDSDIIAWLKASGPGYQTRMNAALRDYMERTLRATGAKSGA